MSSVVELSRALAESLAEPETVPVPEPLLLEPGIYRDLTMEQYLALPYVGASGLHLLGRSPMQFHHSRTAPRRKTPPLERGTALHLAILEPHLFEDRYIVLGQCEGITGKKERCRYNASAYRNGKHYCGTHDPERGQPMTDEIEVIAGDEFTSVLGMREAVHAHPRARSLFEGRGDFELTCIADDPETGVRYKVRPDRLIERAGMLVDLKSARDASPAGFARHAEALGYFVKLALYRRALRALDWPYINAVVLAVEPAAPHDLTPFLVDEDSLNSADMNVSRLLRLYRECEDSGLWPGYSADFAYLTRPAWAQNNGD